MADVVRRIGLSLGADLCWPICYEELLGRLDLGLHIDGDVVRFEVDRVTIEPFDLRQPCPYDLVVDRLTHWYTTSREWIKKSVVMDGLYVFNNPWAIQSMEKHTSYCAMMRLGMPIPETWMVPPKSYEPLPDLDPTLRRYAASVRPGRRRPGRGLSAVRQALRRRWLGRREPGRRRVGPARRLRQQRDLPAARPEGGLSARSVRPLRRLRAPDPSGALRPVRPAARPLHDGRRRSRRRRAVRDRRHDAHDQLVLRMGVQLLRGVAPERRVAPDRLRQRVPRLAGDLAPLPLPVAGGGQPAVVDLLRRDQDGP